MFANDIAMDAGTPNANLPEMNPDPDHQTPQHRRPHGRRRSSARIRHSHAVYNTTSFGGNRAQYQVPSGVFSPSPAAPSPGSPRPGHRHRTRSVARTESEGQQPLPVLPAAPMASESKWKPSIVLNSPLWLIGEDPSRIEIADRKIAQRRLWKEHNGDSPYFADLLEQAIRERNLLDEDDEENTKPKSTLASTHAKAVADRVASLQTVLETSEFPPEHENISAAISGYISGEIRYSDFYTLIWAGRIVVRLELTFSSGNWELNYVIGQMPGLRQLHQGPSR